MAVSKKFLCTVVAWLTATSAASASAPAWSYVKDADSYSNLCLDNNQLGFVCDCPPETLVCRGRGIEQLSSDLLLPDSTTDIDFSRNEIVSVSDSITWPGSVRTLDLSRNSIEEIKEGSFANLDALRSLNLAHNRLSNLSTSAFAALRELESLDLSHNFLTAVQSEWLLPIPGLKRLDISSNPLGVHGDPLHLHTLRRLSYLDLSNCSLSFLPLDIFDNNTELLELRLHRNPLNTVPLTQIYAVRTSLEFLDLTETLLEIIPNHAFHGLFTLRTLLLNNLAFLEQVEALAFHDLESLDTLEMQNNKNLVYIDPYAFYNNFQVEFPNRVANVYLGNNGLQFLSSSLFVWSDLDTIHLEGNPWRCDCDLSWMAEVRDTTDIVWSDFTVCYSPEQLRDLPIKELNVEDFDCSDPRRFGWISLGLFVSTVLVISAFMIYMVWLWHKAQKSQPASLPPSRPSVNSSRPQSNSWARLQGLFHKNNVRFGYNVVRRSDRGFMTLDNSEQDASRSVNFELNKSSAGEDVQAVGVW